MPSPKEEYISSSMGELGEAGKSYYTLNNQMALRQGRGNSSTTPVLREGQTSNSMLRGAPISPVQSSIQTIQIMHINQRIKAKMYPGETLEEFIEKVSVGISF